MGNNRFKLWELIPNAWVYKLRDMGKKSSKKQQNISVSPSPINKHQTVPPPSYYARPAPSRKSASNRLRHRATTFSSTTSVASSSATGTESEFRSDQLLIPDESLESSNWHSPSKLDLRPIITKPANKATTVRKKAVSSPNAGVRLRLRSPRISTRITGTSSSRRSRAVVKASVDPRRDFKESMEEMISENNIRASKDLEELLACYLCLNSDEYHHIIINVFKQIWLDQEMSLRAH